MSTPWAELSAQIKANWTEDDWKIYHAAVASMRRGIAEATAGEATRRDDFLGGAE